MPTTYKAIATVTVGAGGASSISFSSIPNTYTDLKLVLSGRSTDTYGNGYYDSYITLNSTSGTSRVFYQYNGTVTTGVDASNSVFYGVSSSGATANTFGNGEFYLANYLGSNNKILSVDTVSETDGATAITHMSANRHTVTSAITSITLTPYNSPTAKFAQYTTAYLYGIKNS